MGATNVLQALNEGHKEETEKKVWTIYKIVYTIFCH